MTGTSAPMLLAAKLWEKVSAKGNRYFIGRLGGVRILILENRSRGAEGEPDWQLFFCDGEKRENSHAETPAAREPRRRAPYPPRQAVARPPIQPDQPGIMADDRIDDIGREGAP
jgi:hypothetical protein